MEKTFDVFADIVNKDSMVKTYNERRQKACMNMVCQIEFLEQKLAKMKKDLLNAKRFNRVIMFLIWKVL